MSGAKNARYNTSEVIAWLEEMVATATRGLDAARKSAGAKGRTAEFRRAEEDILILAGLGAYYANLFRAALLYSIHEQTRRCRSGAPSVAAYRKAVDAWVAMAARAKTVYAADVSYGSTAFRRGHWVDRIPAMQQDVGCAGGSLCGAGTEAECGGAIRRCCRLVVDSLRAAVAACACCAADVCGRTGSCAECCCASNVHGGGALVSACESCGALDFRGDAADGRGLCGGDSGGVYGFALSAAVLL